VWAGRLIETVHAGLRPLYGLRPVKGLAGSLVHVGWAVTAWGFLVDWGGGMGGRER